MNLGCACVPDRDQHQADAAAIARAAVTCAESGSKREAVRIALDLGTAATDRLC